MPYKSDIIIQMQPSRNNQARPLRTNSFVLKVCHTQSPSVSLESLHLDLSTDEDFAVFQFFEKH